MAETLSLEQMNYLVDLGFRASDASMIQMELDQTDASMSFLGRNALIKKTDYSRSLVDGGLAFYVYTLQNVLDKLPRVIRVEDDEYTLRLYPISGNLWGVAYIEPQEERENTLKVFSSSLLDAAYKMLCWARTNGYMEP